MFVTLDAVEVRLGAFTLGPVDLEIGDGVTALLGENGAGKSTLQRVLVGTEPVASGRVTSGDGTALRVGYLPQDFGGPRRVTVRDFLTYVAWCRSTKQRPIGPADVADALDRVGLTDKAAARFGQLSGGMVRRVGIAQALLGGNDLLVLDEPTVGLDPVQRTEILRLVAEVGTRTPVVMSTHIASDVVAAAESIVVLAEGRILFHGDAAELVGDRGETNAETVEAAFVELVTSRAGARRG